jgi:uncharacterized protein YdhG (YjbR/CyaY superfamily)
MTDITTPADVDAYLASLPADRHEVFTMVRARIHAAISGLGETISYTMPAVTRNGDVVLFFAAWKHHIGMYPIARFDDPLEARVAPFRAAKDTVRFPYKKAIPDGLIEALTVAIVARHDDLVIRQPAPKTAKR